MAQFKSIAKAPPLDVLTRAITAFDSFEELTDDTQPTYRPTIYVDTLQGQTLANAYDRTMTARGDSRRAYRMMCPTKPKPAKIALKCNECAKSFKVSQNARDPQCPKCGSVDFDVR